MIKLDLNYHTYSMTNMTSYKVLTGKKTEWSLIVHQVTRHRSMMIKRQLAMDSEEISG